MMQTKDNMDGKPVSTAMLDIDDLVKRARAGVSRWLDTALADGKIDAQTCKNAQTNTFTHIEEWLRNRRIDEVSPHLKRGISDAILKERWEDLINAFWKKMDFGTGGIRGLMAADKAAIEMMKAEGIDAPFLKGTNTLNNVVLLITSAGVAKFGLEKGFGKIVIGYDSRVRGADFARIIAELFLAYGYRVYLFDSPCPYPEVTFAIPYEEIKADMGILISASHNDYRYNGYKLSCGNGSQFDPAERKELYGKFILNSKPEDIRMTPLSQAPAGQLVFLGGGGKIDGVEYHGCEVMDLHKAHRDHIKSFLLFDEKVTAGNELAIAFCPFHGAGRVAVPRLLNEIGFQDVKMITHNGLSELDGLFPSFSSEPGNEQQPDPGDPRAAEVAVAAFKQEHPGQWENTDILIGTDPDADRCGVVVKIPEKQQFLYNYKDYMLMPADDMWGLILWYRVNFDKALDPEKTFIVLSHTTSDSSVRLARKHGFGVIKTWVGFAALSAGVRDTWNGSLESSVQGLIEGRKDATEDCHPFICDTLGMFDTERSYNLAAMEQSNGFSLLGFPPEDEYSLGVKGHVRDKDGTFASVLVAEIAQWAKQHGTSIFEMVDKNIYLDPDIGLFVNLYEPDPLDGEYPGIEGNRIKKAILRRALGLHQLALAGGLEIGGVPVSSASIYRTGKYDHIYTKTHDFQFPDEGVRFFFNFYDDPEPLNHLTIRPSGTSNALRFHIQLHYPVDEANLLPKKKELHDTAQRIMADIRDKVGAPT